MIDIKYIKTKDLMVKEKDLIGMYNNLTMNRVYMKAERKRIRENLECVVEELIQREANKNHSQLLRT